MPLRFFSLFLRPLIRFLFPPTGDRLTNMGGMPTLTLTGIFTAFFCDRL